MWLIPCSSDIALKLEITIYDNYSLYMIICEYRYLYYWKIVNIFMYLIKYSNIMPCSVEQKILFCENIQQNNVFQDFSSKKQKEVKF